MTAAAALDVFHVPLGGVQLIEASAGTGKTWAICGLVLRLLLAQRLTVQQVLVVTFTNAATAELRERLRQRLVDVLAGLKNPPAPGAAPAADPFVPDLLASLHAAGLTNADLQPRLEQALQDFDEAAIFTIHGFCQRALADTPLAALMPLQQELLADDSALLAEVVQDFWRQRVASPSAGSGCDAALAAHLLASGDSPERWTRLLKRHLARPLSRLVWPADIDSQGDRDALQQRLQTAFTTAKTAWATQRADVLAALDRGLKGLHKTYYKPDAPAAAGTAWDALLAAPQPPAEAPEGAMLLAADNLTRRTTKGNSSPTHPFFGAAQALLDAMASSSRALALARLRLLRDLLAQGAQRQREAKRARRVVAFDDMLANLHQRLHDPAAPGLAAALRQRFPAALIDEFQDTDPLQWAVFQAVYGTPDADGAPLFLVGDPKQAIYSFRHADLHTYLAARSQAQAVHTLAQNQRSVGPLIAALNRLFGMHARPLMQPGLDYHPVSEGSKRKAVLVDSSEPRAPLQVWTLPRPAGGPLLKSEAKRRAAATCAGEITRLLTEARAGRISLGGLPLQAGQIAVLVRSHAQGSVMRQALAALGVGSVELSQASVFQGPDAEELERVLAAMLQPGRDGLLKAALATRWMGLAAHQIDTLAGDETAWLEQVLAFGRWGVTWRQRGIGVVLQQWRQAAGIAERLLAAPDGARRLTNLLHLGELLHQASADQPSPEALLRWLQVQRDDPRGDDATQLRLESDQHLVQIVTIHKSKGLEYPVVFCPFLWDGRSSVQADGLDGIAVRDDDGSAAVDFRSGLDEAFDETSAKAQAKLDDAAETLRLIYVALTRAVQRCYLVAGSYTALAFGKPSTTESGRSLLNWLVLGGADGGLTGSDWFSSKRKPAPPFEVDAAWQTLAAPGALAVDMLPPAHHQPLPPSDDDTAPLAALAAPAPLPRPWWIGSYSGLTQQLLDSPAAADAADASPLQPRAGADHDAAVDDLSGADGSGSAPMPSDDIRRFPRGAQAGECLHAAFELADFTNAASWPGAAERALRAHGPLATRDGADAACLSAMLQRCLADVLATPLPVGTATPLRLAALGPRQRLVELEFHLHAPQLSANALQRTLAAHGYPAPRFGFGALQGYLKGFIDLVVEHEGRWFIADWKSNHLGDAPADYAQAGLDAAMTAHHYQLQSLVYSLALQRWLQQRLPGYRYDTHFGGALYLFVRGLRPGWHQADGRPAGLHWHRPSAAVLQQLDALLDGGLA